ncbi:glycoside hydrolase family 29 [Flavilitoribacter nigricans DSM 23189 = NBRC 102662]|uniref:alpha-L-fucosidase n=1 Tax=Flavilitoribacter nigricans (strain ATCC 23147 / DSM 23189 / NBRC 102662 / NCIMB 1420 / SS-2) TaxID=1122177 RepID=A0A2D0NCA3_FLAN2|nr:glycoside hydrolase family 29 [Flavilitoribacter nigricans DSM 23189 = NBRC 102662]
MERPFVYQENGVPEVLSVAVKKGNDSYLVFIPVEKAERPLPNHRQLAWQQAELGAIFHYDLHVFDGQKYGQAGNRISPVPDYQIFRPEQLDTDQWVRAIKEAGFTFALLTATHETGFALFQSEVNPYSMKALNFQEGKGDLVRDFVNSCRKYGIKPGIYLGIRWNSFFGVHNFQVQGEGEFREQRQRYYNQMVEGMLREICTNYGELFEIWFDGGADHPDNGVPDVLPIAQQYQPNCLFYHNLQLAEVRWGGSESGAMDYPCWATFPNPYSHGGDTHAERMRLLKQGDPDGAYWMPAMADAPLRGYNGRHEWFWEPDDEAHIFPVENLMNMYEKSVGRNATLIVGLTPDPKGLMPEADVKRLQEWGNAIKEKYGTPLAQTGGKGREIQLQLETATPIGHVIIQEDIAQGERVRNYRIEIKNRGKWQEVASGISVGHKRIQAFEPVTAKRIRLIISEATDEALITNFSVFKP